MKEEFVKYYQQYITREGGKELLEYLEKSDFFTAPASTRFHGDHRGGLCEHSVNVFKHLVRLASTYKKELGVEKWEQKAESIAICSLLHDLCKIGCYKVDMRNRKNEQGVWEKYPAYSFDEQEPMGFHGPKSARVIERYIKLTDEEWVAIATHMGAWDRNPGDPSLNSVYDEPKYRLSVLLSIADEFATYFDETKKNEA